MFDEELSAQMYAQPVGNGARRVRNECPRREKTASRHSTERNAGGGISVISALLTGRRSRSAACVIVAVVISLTAVVSVAASIVASHISYANESGKVTDSGERNVLSASGGTLTGDHAAENEPDLSGNVSSPGSVSSDESAPDDTNAQNGENKKDTVSDGAEQTNAPANVGDGDKNNTDSADSSPNVSRKYTVTLNFWDRESVSIETAEASLGDVISASGTQLSAAQLANLDLTKTVEADISVNVDVVTYETEDVEETIPYETEYVQSASLAAGVTEVTRQGVEGNQTRRFTVTYVNGAEVSRVQTASWVDSYVQNQVITTGTGQSVVDNAPPQSTAGDGSSNSNTGAGTVTGANGATYSYSSYLDVQATCYYAGGTTAYGLPADENVIGVDPSVIPFGTRVYVVGPYGDFGVRIAADCGHMYGNRIDVCLNRDNPLAAGFGWQSMRVYILD